MPIDPRPLYRRGSWITGIIFLRRWRDPAEGYDADLDTESDHELLELCVVVLPTSLRRNGARSSRTRATSGPGPTAAAVAANARGKRRLFSGGAEGEAGGPSSSGCAA